MTSLANAITKRRRLIGPLLLIGLLFLRLPYLIVIRTYYQNIPALATIFKDGTLLLTAILLWWERNRLREFHITKGVLVIFIGGPVLSSFINYIWWGNQFLGQIPLFQIIIAFGLIWVIKRNRPIIQQHDYKIHKWIFIAVVVGVCVGIIVGYLNGLQGVSEVTISRHRSLLEVSSLVFSFKSWLTILPLFLIQLSNAAALEEPLFRGFLWGYLRILGWKDEWILPLQALLFWVGHIYYWGEAPYSLWIMVPLSGIVLGLLAWRSRSITTSMVAHGLINSIGDFSAHW